MPLTGVCGMAATLPPFQGGKTTLPLSGYAVAVITGPPGSSNAHTVPMINVGSTTVVPKPTRADLLLDLAEARQAFLEAEEDLDHLSDPESSHSNDVDGGAASFGQPPSNGAQESPSTGVYSSPRTTTPSTKLPVCAYDAMNSVYTCGASAEPFGTATGTGLSQTRPVPPYSHRASTEPSGTPASTLTSKNSTDTAPSSITVAGIHPSQVTRRQEDLRDECASGRGHSIGRKSWTQGSALPLHATSRQITAHDGGSEHITDAVSSLVRQHRGKGASRPEHSVPTPVPTVLSASAGIQHGGNETALSASAGTQRDKK